MKNLIWKKGKPEKHGWYWMCEDGFLYDFSCWHIQFMYPIVDGEKVIDLTCENDSWFGKNWHDNYWFAGPILKPIIT